MQESHEEKVFWTSPMSRCMWIDGMLAGCFSTLLVVFARRLVSCCLLLLIALEIWGIDRRLVEDRRNDVKNARRSFDCRGALVDLGKRATGFDYPQETAGALKKD